VFLARRFLSPWWWKRYVPLKRRFLQKSQGVRSQKTIFFRVTSVKISSLENLVILHQPKRRNSKNSKQRLEKSVYSGYKEKLTAIRPSLHLVTDRGHFLGCTDSSWVACIVFLFGIIKLYPMFRNQCARNYITGLFYEVSRPSL
jgi:hypothetical protein